MKINVLCFYSFQRLMNTCISYKETNIYISIILMFSSILFYFLWFFGFRFSPKLPFPYKQLIFYGPLGLFSLKKRSLYYDCHYANTGHLLTDWDCFVSALVNDLTFVSCVLCDTLLFEIINPKPSLQFQLFT